jgi:hypothetical protein
LGKGNDVTILPDGTYKTRIARISSDKFHIAVAPCRIIFERPYEAFAGPHDWLSSLGYNAAGNAVAWTQSGLGPTIFNVYSGVALFPAAAIVGVSTAPELIITKETGYTR